MGGSSDDAPIDVDSGSKKYKLWEMQTHCLVTLISKKGLLTVDEVWCLAALHHLYVSAMFLIRVCCS